MRTWLDFEWIVNKMSSCPKNNCIGTTENAYSNYRYQKKNLVVMVYLRNLLTGFLSNHLCTIKLPEIQIESDVSRWVFDVFWRARVCRGSRPRDNFIVIRMEGQNKRPPWCCKNALGILDNFWYWISTYCKLWQMLADQLQNSNNDHKNDLRRQSRWRLWRLSLQLDHLGSGKITSHILKMFGKVLLTYTQPIYQTSSFNSTQGIGIVVRIGEAKAELQTGSELEWHSFVIVYLVSVSVVDTLDAVADAKSTFSRIPSKANAILLAAQMCCYIHVNGNYFVISQ